jgi:uncharacterized iron-regulated membrane protein
MRPLCVILHRYIGLATALFLVLLGLTGSVIAAAAIALTQAHSRGWAAVPEGIYHDVARRFWFVYFEKSAAQWATAGSYGVFVDDRSGAVTYVRTPKGTAADVFVNWLSALHMGEVFGIPYKIVLCLLGLVVAGLSATGVLIWWRKLRSRHAMHRRKVALARLAGQSVSARSLAALLCLVAGILLAGALTGAMQYIF